MASDAKEIVDYLSTDATLVALLTGGLYCLEDVGQEGITFSNTPSAWDGPNLKPCLVVKGRDTMPTREIVDEVEQVMSYRRIIQIFIYAELGEDTLEQAAQLVYNNLQNKSPFTGAVMILFGGDAGRQAEELAGANFVRQDYMLYGLKQPSV